jgi:hypothetical protein
MFDGIHQEKEEIELENILGHRLFRFFLLKSSLLSLLQPMEKFISEYLSPDISTIAVLIALDVEGDGVG